MKRSLPKWTGEPLPRLMQDTPPETVEALVLWHMQLPMRELRQRRDIHREQKQMALRQNMLPEAISEGMRDDLVTDAIWRLEYGCPMHGRHTPVDAAGNYIEIGAGE